jgi:SAM-dependent methyltransferase
MAPEPRTIAQPGVKVPPENIFGHLERVRWMTRHLKATDRILEVGCGTGSRILLPLRAWGYSVYGIDVDESSIEYGRKLMRRSGLDPDILILGDVGDLDEQFDAVILSEVCEHLSDVEISALLGSVHARLRPGGRLLVTVPNGYGWYELEAFLWKKTGVGRVLTATGVAFLIRRARALLAGGPTYDPIASSLSSSPHVQRFTLQTISTRLARAGFRVVERRGSVLLCGPFSDLLLTGFVQIMRLNSALGARLPGVSAGFYLAARRA